MIKVILSKEIMEKIVDITILYFVSYLSLIL